MTVHDQDPYSQGRRTATRRDREWQESLRQLVQAKGPARAREIMLSLLKGSKELHLNVPMVPTTDYINTISQKNEPDFPVTRSSSAATASGSAGTPRSPCTARSARHRRRRPHLDVRLVGGLYEVGFNHFFRGLDDPSGGDQIFIQGHASPGAYARAFLEGD